MLQLSFVNFRAGSYLTMEGKTDNDRFFIIQVGQVSCHHENEVPGTTPTKLGPGDFVGVIPCMSGHSQIENVVAITDVVAISVRKDQYAELITQNTAVAMKIIRAFANTMRTLNDNLTKLTLNKATVDSSDHLYNVASYYDKSGLSSIAIYAYYQYLKSCPGGFHSAEAKKRFITLKPITNAVYFESAPDLVRAYPKDTMIFSESQYGADMFIIQDGTVRITKVVDGNEVVLAVLKKGDMFGEMALLENKPRSACAIAHEACKLMVINKSNFDQMVTTQPQLISRLTVTLAERVWSMYRQLSNTLLSDPVMKMLDMMALQVEKAKVTVAKNTSYQSELSLSDLANMCGIPKEAQQVACYKLTNDPHIKIVDNKILVPDVLELLKQASFNLKQNKNR